MKGYTESIMTETWSLLDILMKGYTESAVQKDLFIDRILENGYYQEHPKYCSQAFIFCFSKIESRNGLSYNC